MGKIFFEIFEELARLNNSGKYTTFWSFSGHTMTADIRIYRGQWADKKKPIFDRPMIKLDSPNYVSSFTGESFDPQAFKEYLAALWKFRPTKQRPILTYPIHDKPGKTE